jgi:tetratricopeptide (TPR) repeat protein
MRLRGLPFVPALLLAGCLVGGGAQQFRAGEKAYTQGDLPAAEKAYAEALEKDPANAEYKAALAKVREEMARKHISDAQSKEKAADWVGASTAWGEAARLVPGNSDYAVRRDLSGQKAKNLGPDEWYAAVSVVAAQHAGNEIAQRSLAGARAAAYQHNVQMAEEFLSAGAGTRAYEFFQRAKEIDPSTPGMRVDSFAQAEALAVSEQGDVKLAEGDPIRAYELYQEAYAKRPLPEIKKKLEQVKRQASALLSKLDQARKEADRGKYLPALKLYEGLLGMSGVPASVGEEMAKVRGELVKQDCAEAKALIDKGNLSKAQRVLQAVVEHAQLDKVKSDVLARGFTAGANGRPDQTLTAIEAAGLESGTPLEETSFAFALAAAKQVLAQAERVSGRDASKALKLVANLDPFQEELPGIGELRRKLRASSFEDLLTDALEFAKKGNDGEAAATLLAALNSSKAPEDMRAPAAEAAEHLKAGGYAQAEEAFTRAQAAAPRSRLAQRGIDIARLRRKAAEKDAVDALTSARGNQARAVELLEAAARLEPGNDNTRAGAAALLARVEKVGSESDADVGALLEWAVRLASLPEAAKGPALNGAAALKEGDLGAAASGFEEAQDAASGERLPKLARELVAKRQVSSLKGDVAAVLNGDESAAEALAELLEKHPDDATGQRVLRQLLDKAEKLAAEKQDAEAARYLKLATVATRPAPGVKAALDKGNEALGKGDMQAAEQAYDDARDLEAAHPVATSGYGIARGARQGALTKALAEAKAGGSLEPLTAAMKAAVALDPNSKEAREAFAELIREAERQADGGNVPRAAQLLEAANAVSKPEQVQAALTKANGLLEKKEFEGAQAAYAEVLKGGDSQVAQTGTSICKEQTLSGLVKDLNGLEQGDDVERGAKAAQALLRIDPANKKVARAVEAALARADKAADKGDDKAAAKELGAAALALGEDGALSGAVTELAAAKYPEAQAAFEGSTSEVGRRGAALARRRNLGTLASSLDAGGEDAAKGVRKLLAADPNNAEAKKAFEGMLEAARGSAKAGKDAEAAQSLRFATIAAGAASDLTSALDVGAEHLAASRYPEAEQAYLGALELAKDSKVASTGHEVAKGRRLEKEQEALRALEGADDPRPHAEVLKRSRLVEPDSKVVEKGYQQLLARASKGTAQANDADVAQTLEAAATLEARSSEQQAGVQEAAALLAKASFVEAQSKFTAVNAGREGGDVSAVAELGAKLALQRRVALLEAELAQAETAKDVLRQSTLVAKILELDPAHKDAGKKAKLLEGKVKSERVAAAKTQKEQGKLGVAYLYLSRALALDPKDGPAQAEQKAVEEALGKRLDLIMVVPGIQREKVSASQCKGLDGLLQEALQTSASKRTDLGGYVLSPAWTQAVEKGDERAPDVSGSLTVTMTRCSLGSATGDAVFKWVIRAPKDGKVVAEGTVKADLPAGTIPRDEQDGAGEHARAAFSQRAADLIGEKVSQDRDKTEAWLMTLAEHGMEKNDPALVADAWARIKVKASKLVDVERLLKVEAYLDEQFR